MTAGERIAWVWVWSAFAILSVTMAIGVSLYWRLPLVYFNSFLCSSQSQATAGPACGRIIADEQAPAEIRANALRRLAVIASGAGDEATAVGHLTALVQSGMATAEDWNNRGLSYFALREYDKAAADFRRAAFTNSAEPLYWSNMADAQLEAGKFSDAIQNYTTAMRKGNDSADVRGNRGWARYQLGSYRNALEDYDKALAKNDRHADNFNERGLVRHALGDYALAVADFDRSIKLQGENAVNLTNRAMSYSRLGEREKARQDLERAISLNRDYAPAHFEIAWLWIDQGQPDKAMLQFKELERIGPLDVYTLEARSQAHLDLEHWKDAVADADQAIALGSQADWLYRLRFKAKYEMADFKGAIADSTSYLNAHPADIEALVVRAYSLQMTGQSDAAFADMDYAIKASSDPAYAYETRGYLNLLMGRLSQAVFDARQAVALAPQSADSAAMLGRAFMENGEASAALAECSRAVTLREADFTYRCRALANLALNQTALALSDINTALGLRPSASNYYALGQIELARGNARAALDQFNRAIAMDTYSGPGMFMYRGDAERALGDVAMARRDYMEARKLDLGLYRNAVDERLNAIAAQ